MPRFNPSFRAAAGRIPATVRRCLLVFTVALLPVRGAPPAAAQRPPNVLFIAVDDLRPEFGAYGADYIQAPHLDRLARQSVRFDRAYCMVPTCGASRASMLSSVRPTPTRFITYQARADTEAPWAVTLNTHFRQQGYHTVSLGKVFHHADDSTAGWTDAPWLPDVPLYQLEENEGPADQLRFGLPVEHADVPDEAYADGQIAREAIARLRGLANTPAQPFFLAVGFMRPHLPFVAPQRYWDLYPDDSIHLPADYAPPIDVPAEAMHPWAELRSYRDIPRTGPVSDDTARRLIHGYYACVSYSDAQIGKVLDELDRLGLADNTIVVLWGDHGWNLGDHSLWCKHCTFETAMRVPLLVRAPGIAGDRHTAGLTESIDIFPSLCELAGLPVPASVEGKSFVPLLRQPDRAWAEAAVGRFQAGDTIRTDHFRYSEYHAEKGAGAYLSRMLYDHTADPSETRNVAEQPALAPAVEALRATLHRTAAATAQPVPLP